MLTQIFAVLAAASLTAPVSIGDGPVVSPSARALGNTVVYVTSTSAGNTLMRGTLNGSVLTDQQELNLSVPGTPVDAAVSPQGDKAVVVLNQGASDSLVLVTLSSSASGIQVATLASALDILDPSFAPAGDKVVFAVSEASKTRPHPRVVSLSGTIVADMDDHKPAYSPSLSPDGRWVAYAKGTPTKDKEFPLMVADTTGIGETTAVESFSQGGGALDVAWAPDGSSIGYTMFTGQHYGVALTDAWGRCSDTVLFEDQPTGKNNALYYHFGGFITPTSMLAFLEDRTSGRAEVRTFSADACSRDFTGVVRGNTIVPAFAGAVLAASTSWTAGPVTTPTTKLPTPKIRQQNKRLDIDFSSPTNRGYGPLKVTYTGPDGRASLAWEGFVASGVSPEVTPSTVYSVSGFVAPWSSPGLNLGAADTYRTPDATTLSVSIGTQPPTAERYRTGTVVISGKLSVSASDFGLPYQRIGFSLAPSGPGETRYLTTASTDGDGFFSFEQAMPFSGTLVASYTGDDDRFAADWSRPVKVTSLSLKANPGVTEPGKAVKWAVTITPNVASAPVRMECFSKGSWSLVRAFPGRGKLRTLSLKAAPGACRAVLVATGSQLVSVSSPRSLVLR